MTHPRNKHERIRVGKDKLRKLYEETYKWYGAGAYYDEDKGIYIKYSCASKYWRKYSNKVVRRNILFKLPKGSSYKKLFDYWWTIL